MWKLTIYYNDFSKKEVIVVPQAVIDLICGTDGVLLDQDSKTIKRGHNKIATFVADKID